MTSSSLKSGCRVLSDILTCSRAIFHDGHIGGADERGFDVRGGIAFRMPVVRGQGRGATDRRQKIAGDIRVRVFIDRDRGVA